MPHTLLPRPKSDPPRAAEAPTERDIMYTESLTLHDIQNGHEFLRTGRSLELDQERTLVEDGLPPLRDKDVPDEFWLGAVALFIAEDGFDGNAIVCRNQDHVLTARAAGFTVGEIAQYVVLKEREALR